MRMVRRTLALLLVGLLLTLTACAKKSAPPPTSTVTIDEVRKQVAAAFDGTTSSAQRRTAADEAMRLLLALLQDPASVSISDADWSASPRPGVGAMVRHFDLHGGIHLYALALPGNTLVETRERVAVQVRKSGLTPAASELPLLPDSKLQAAQALKDGSKQMITLALSLNAGGGYVAHFQMTGAGVFQLSASAFAGLDGSYGDTSLSLKDGYLMVVQQGVAEWRPSFDAKHPLRLLLGPGLTLDWKQKFVVVDDSRFDAFALFKIALNPSSCKGPDDCPEALLEQAKTEPKEVAKAAWAQATAKMTALLQNDKSWSDDFAGKLPPGARSMREQAKELSVRLLTVPAPEGVAPRAYTAVQFKAAGGLPLARMLNLPGMVDAVKVMNHAGAPSLFLLVDATTDPKSTQKTKLLQLMHLNADNEWVPAEQWVGSVPVAANWNLAGSTPDSVTIGWDSGPTGSPHMSVALSGGAEPAVAICKFPTDCHKLTWLGGKLHALEVLTTQLTEASRALPEDQILWRAGELSKFLSFLDPAAISASQLISALDPAHALGIQVLDAGGGVRLVTMPANPTPVRTAVVHAKGFAHVVPAYNGFVTQWSGVKIVQGGNTQRLLILGTSDKGAALITYESAGDKWVLVDALAEKVDRVLMESVRVVNVPGQTRPVPGLIVVGDPRQLTAKVTADGVQFCENQIACVTYRYDNGWQLK